MALKVSLKFDSWCRRRPCRDCCCCCYYYRYHPTTTTTTLDAASRVLVCSSTHSTTTTLFVQRSVVVVVVVVPSSSSSSSNSRSRQKRLQPSPPSRSSLFLVTSLFVSSSLVFFPEKAVWFARPPFGCFSAPEDCDDDFDGVGVVVLGTFSSFFCFLFEIDRKSVTSSGPKQKNKTKKKGKISTVWRKHHHHHHSTFYQKLQNIFYKRRLRRRLRRRRRSRGDESERYRAREGEEVVGYKMWVATRWCAALINKSRLQKIRRIRRRFRRRTIETTTKEGD